MRDFTVLIAKSIPAVVSAIKPNPDPATGFQEVRQPFKSPFAIGRVMEYSDAVYAVKRLRGKRKGKNVCLYRDEVSAC
jgi:hypothetical protein